MTDDITLDIELVEADTTKELRELPSGAMFRYEGKIWLRAMAAETHEARVYCECLSDGNFSDILSDKQVIPAWFARKRVFA